MTNFGSRPTSEKNETTSYSLLPPVFIPMPGSTSDSGGNQDQDRDGSQNEGPGENGLITLLHEFARNITVIAKNNGTDFQVDVAKYGTASTPVDLIAEMGIPAGNTGFSADLPKLS